MCVFSEYLVSKICVYSVYSVFQGQIPAKVEGEAACREGTQDTIKSKFAMKILDFLFRKFFDFSIK